MSAMNQNAFRGFDMVSRRPVPSGSYVVGVSTPEKATKNPELVHLIYVADLILSRFMVGQEMERMETESLDCILRKLGLNPRQFAVIVDGIPRTVLDDRLARS